MPLYSSLNARSCPTGGFLPPKTIPADFVPAPPKPHLAVFKFQPLEHTSAVMTFDDVVNSSVVAIEGGP